MVKRLFVLIALVSASATAAHAQMSGATERAQHWDFSLQTRYTTSHEYSGQGGSSVSLEDDLGWGFAFGYNANERFNVGFLMSWRTINYSATVVSATDLGDGFDYSNWLDIGTFGVSGDWNVLPKRFTPYVSGVLGWTFVDTNVSAGASSACWWDPWWGYVCGTYPTTFGTDAFSYAIGAGLRLEMSEAFFLRVGYEYDGIDLDNVNSFNIFRVDAGLTY